MTLPTIKLAAGRRAWPIVGAVLILLNASLTFANVWPTPNIRWQNALSIELAVCVLLLALIRRPWTPLVRRILPALWLVLVLGHYIDVTGPALYGRAFNLYWDAPHLGNVFAMLSEAAPIWLLAVAGIGAALALAAAFVVSRAALECVGEALARPRLRPIVVSLMTIVVVIFAIQRVTDRQQPAIVFADPVTPAYAHQLRSVLAMIGPGAVAPTLGASPDALATPPNGLGGADVHLVFVESYGAVTFDSPAFASALAPSRATFDAAARDTGQQVVSAYVESPTFGGSSWLAHLSLMSGIDVRDQYSYQSLMTQPRETLGTTFARAGYRTVALMPGMRQAWPEGAFYRYDAIYGRSDLNYTGPRFGWWSIPDQYALAKLDALEAGSPTRVFCALGCQEGARATRRPLFVVFPTSTTHAPFGPVAPYQPDWSKMLTSDAYDAAEVERILARTPDLTNLSADYAHAMSYEFLTFAGYLREHAADDIVTILIGDHQPAAAVAGQGAPWTVPIHIVTRQPQIVERLIAHGFRRGLTPQRPSLGGMHQLVPILLAAFSAPGN